MNKEFDVFGIGSPLIDIYMEAEDHHLVELKLEKGNMHLIDHGVLERIQQNHKNPVKTSVAGDVVNTVLGVSAMGGRAVFCGKVGSGKYGDMFEEVLVSENIKPVLARCNENKTGRVISFVTKDAERTMTTYLGAAVGLKKEESTFDDLMQSQFLYTSGYVFDSDNLKDTVMHTLEIAKKNNIKVAFDLADPGVISRHKEELKEIIKEYAYIVFVNETEAKAFTGKEPEDALDELAEMSTIAVVKLGEKGSIIRSGDKKIEIRIIKENAVDTTGAGDMYAAGFLYALTKTNDLKIAGDIASFASAKIVQQYGAKLENHIKEEVENMLEGKNSFLTE